MNKSCDSVIIETVHGLKERVMLRCSQDTSHESDLERTFLPSRQRRNSARLVHKPIVMPLCEAATSPVFQK
jgi:hypothetical protein